MRALLLLVAMVLVTLPAGAQQVHTLIPGCLNSGSSGSVVVRMERGDDIRGTLLCVTDEDVTILRDGERLLLPLTEILQVERPRRGDPIWDVPLASVALVTPAWLVTGGPWRDGRHLLRVTLATVAAATFVDIWHTDSARVVVTGTRRRASMQWTFRF